MKAFTTPTCTLSVWVVEYELALDLVINEVHLCPDHKHKGPFVDNDPNTALLDNFIEFSYLVLFDIVHNI